MPDIDSHPHGTPSWFDLMTDDVEGARAFYGKVFDWEFDVGSPDSGFYSIAKRRGRKAAGMGQKPADASFPNAWTVYFAVDDCDAAVALASEHGAHVSMQPMDVFDQGRMAMLADPTGGVYGLWQPGAHRGAEITAEHGAMAWCEVNTRDLDRATDYYSAVYDLSPREIDMPSRYATLHRGEPAVAGVLQMTDEWGDMPPHWMPYFAVADADAACAVIAAEGGNVAHGPFDTPYGRMAVCTDPSGAAFSVIRPPEQAG